MITTFENKKLTNNACCDWLNNFWKIVSCTPHFFTNSQSDYPTILVKVYLWFANFKNCKRQEKILYNFLPHGSYSRQISTLVFLVLFFLNSFFDWGSSINDVNISLRKRVQKLRKTWLRIIIKTHITILSLGHSNVL